MVQSCSIAFWLVAFSLEQIELVIRMELDDGLFPGGSRLVARAGPPRLAGDIDRPDIQHFHVVEFFNGRLDLALVGLLVDLEAVRILHGRQEGALFRDHRRLDHFRFMQNNWHMSPQNTAAKAAGFIPSLWPS